LFQLTIPSVMIYTNVGNICSYIRNRSLPVMFPRIPRGIASGQKIFRNISPEQKESGSLIMNS